MPAGLQKSDLVILAARPSVGKTSLALNVAMAAAESHYVADSNQTGPPGVAIFSLEMNRRQIIQRLVCTKAQIRMDLLRKNMLNEAQLLKFANTLERVGDLRRDIQEASG